MVPNEDKEEMKRRGRPVILVLGGGFLAFLGFNLDQPLVGALGLLAVALGFLEIVRHNNKMRAAKQKASEEAEIRAHQLRIARGEVGPPPQHYKSPPAQSDAYYGPTAPPPHSGGAASSPQYSESPPAQSDAYYGPTAPPPYSPTRSTTTPTWRWAVAAGSAVVLIAAVFYALKPTETTTTTVSETVTVTAAPQAGGDRLGANGSAAAVPAGATPCPITFASSEFTSSAIGTSTTSCAFAEAVRRAYIDNPVRNSPTVVEAFSPVTNLHYKMSCSGGAVVRCTGGRNADIYVY